MGYNKRNTTLILIITLVSVLGLSIAFAAFSSTLTISSSAKVTPESGDFKVVFSSKSNSLSTTGVTVTKTGNATAGTPTIDNSTNPTISGISANFTKPGEKVEYTFYARNEGSYDAYLSSVVFNNIIGKSIFKECVAGTGTTSSLVASACNGIKITTTVLSDVYTETTLNITGHTLKKNSSEAVKVTIEYTSGSTEADGPFRIDFGNIYLTYGSTSLSGMPTIPTEPICTAVTEATTGNVPTGSFNYGDEYTCNVGDGESKTFFVLETKGDNVSLIMDKNIDSNGKGTTSGNTVAWQTDEDWAAAGGVVTDEMKNDGGVCQEGGFCFTTEYGPLTALKYLKSSTKSWTKLTESQISLPSADQIAKASGKTFSDSGISGLSAWLWGNLWINKTFPYSYWTSTPYESWAAWHVHDGLGYESASVALVIGVRPVITISKSNIQ